MSALLPRRLISIAILSFVVTMPPAALTVDSLNEPDDSPDSFNCQVRSTPGGASAATASVGVARRKRARQPMVLREEIYFGNSFMEQLKPRTVLAGKTARY